MLKALNGPTGCLIADCDPHLLDRFFDPGFVTLIPESPDFVLSGPLEG